MSTFKRVSLDTIHSEPFANLDPKVGGTHDTLQEGKWSLEGAWKQL